jgi:predicted AAA+ superfamily ATPase
VSNNITIMILTTVLQQIIVAQRQNLKQIDTGLRREALQKLPDITTHALIVSGIRRCGKSTLLFQLLKKKYANALYVNFEDSRLYGFDHNDFSKLDEVIKSVDTKVLFFDEIQIIIEWERYVRRKLDEGYKIIITGSNASLLSQELGTRLTGRHISKELFPFSFSEFCSFKKSSMNEKSLLLYMDLGGFPEYLKTKDADILNQLFDDILIRDIAIRYGIRDVKTLQRLALYLISNTGNLITGNRLRNMFEIGATSTVLEYLSNLESACLFQYLPKFNYSLRKQLVNARKVYTVDTGLITINSASFSDDRGRKFENLIFLHLRRKNKEIYYFAEKGECDFIVFSNRKISEAVQVCFTLNPDNQEREINGLLEALVFFNLKQGAIVTINQKDRIEINGKIIHVVPAYDYLNL